MRNTHGLDVMATSIEVRLSVPRTGNSGLKSPYFLNRKAYIDI